MEQEPLISIVIPVYNAEKYLSRCIESILVQRIYEIILINDGSFDSSGDICDEYVRQNDHIKVFHQKNSGVSVARNLGLANATGDWIAFADADDWLEPNWVDVLKDNIEKHNVDLYTFGYSRVTDDGIVSTHIPTQSEQKNTDFITTSDYHYAVWAYIFKRSIIDDYNVNFPINLKFSEDQAFLLKYISISDKVILIETSLYNYFNYSASTVSKNILTFDWALSNLIVANDLLIFCIQHSVSDSYFSYPLKRLYEAFLHHFFMLKIRNTFYTQKLYRSAYRQTLKIYPSFRKQTTFRLAYYGLEFPYFLRFRKYLRFSEMNIDK